MRIGVIAYNIIFNVITVIEFSLLKASDSFSGKSLILAELNHVVLFLMLLLLCMPTNPEINEFIHYCSYMPSN